MYLQITIVDSTTELIQPSASYLNNRTIGVMYCDILKPVNQCLFNGTTFAGLRQLIV